MKIQTIQKDKKVKEDRSVALSIRISKVKSKYMKIKNISPTKLFHNALDEIMKDNPLKKK